MYKYASRAEQSRAEQSRAEQSRAEQSRAEQVDSALFGVLLRRRHPVWDAVGILYSLPDVFCYAGKLCVRRLVRWLEQWRIRMEVMEILYDRGG